MITLLTYSLITLGTLALMQIPAPDTVNYVIVNRPTCYRTLSNPTNSVIELQEFDCADTAKGLYLKYRGLK